VFCLRILSVKRSRSSPLLYFSFQSSHILCCFPFLLSVAHDKPIGSYKESCNPTGLRHAWARQPLICSSLEGGEVRSVDHRSDQAMRPGDQTYLIYSPRSQYCAGKVVAILCPCDASNIKSPPLPLTVLSIRETAILTSRTLIS
jgi:hypothetical protein